MQLLPSELKCIIAKILLASKSEFESPKSLAAFARTHTVFQREAEKALYETLYIFAFNDKSLKCMETLAKNPEKAASVRFLTIEYSRLNHKQNRNLTTYLSKSLINMHILSDFRVKPFSGGIEAQLIEGLCKILWSVCKFFISLKSNDSDCDTSEDHFRLQTFYCEDSLNISQIIKNQTELQVLGLYSRCHSSTPRNNLNVLETLKEFHNARLFLPIVLTLEYGILFTVPDHISIFPAFYSVNRRATIPQVLVQSVRDKYMKAKDVFFLELSIYLIDSSDIPSIYALAKDVAASFPRIRFRWLNLWFERRCEIVSFLFTVDDYNHT
jgi:hypothetical protein